MSGETFAWQHVILHGRSQRFPSDFPLITVCSHCGHFGPKMGNSFMYMHINIYVNKYIYNIFYHCLHVYNLDKLDNYQIVKCTRLGIWCYSTIPKFPKKWNTPVSPQKMVCSQHGMWWDGMAHRYWGLYLWSSTDSPPLDRCLRATATTKILMLFFASGQLNPLEFTLW